MSFVLGVAICCLVKCWVRLGRALATISTGRLPAVNLPASVINLLSIIPAH